MGGGPARAVPRKGRRGGLVGVARSRAEAPGRQQCGHNGGRQWSGTRSRAKERREEGVRSGGAHLEERGGAWATPRTCGSAEEKEKMDHA
jgi:hypothetical protein